MIPTTSHILRTLLMTLLLAASLSIQAQETEANHFLWLDFRAVKPINRFLVYFDQSTRFLFGSEQQQRIIPKVYAGYRVKKVWEFQAGITTVFTNNPGRFSDRLEIRPWQAVKAKWPTFAVVQFSHLGRIEERFSYLVNENWESSFDWRFRYKLSTRIPLTRTRRINSWNLQLYAEFLFDVNEDVQELFRNKNRQGFGVEYIIDRAWSARLMVNTQRSRSGTGEDFRFNELNYQLKVIWKIPPKQKEDE